MEKSWKSTVAIGALVAGIVLLVNLCFFIYMMNLDGFHAVPITLFTGTKEEE